MWQKGAFTPTSQVLLYAVGLVFWILICCASIHAEISRCHMFAILYSNVAISSVSKSYPVVSFSCRTCGRTTAPAASRQVRPYPRPLFPTRPPPCTEITPTPLRCGWGGIFLYSCFAAWKSTWRCTTRHPCTTRQEKPGIFE